MKRFVQFVWLGILILLVVVIMLYLTSDQNQLATPMERLQLVETRDADESMAMDYIEWKHPEAPEGAYVYRPMENGYAAVLQVSAVPEESLCEPFEYASDCYASYYFFQREDGVEVFKNMEGGV